MSTDTLSDVLRAVRLTGAVYFVVDASPPWVAEAPEGRDLAPHLMRGVEHVIDYHVVTAGACWGGLIGEPPIRLETGDVIVFPQGDAHVLSSAPGMRDDPGSSLGRYSVPDALPIAITKNGGGAERCEVICGFLGCDARPFNPLLDGLPRVIHLRKDGPGSDDIEQFVKLALLESSARRSGGECVLARLSELLFIEVVRRFVATLRPDTTGWLAGLRDDSVGRALGKLHHRPAHAERVGYGSEAALSRAFKRWVGVAPAVWRQKKRAPRSSMPDHAPADA